MKKGFTFQQVALILLGLIIIVGLILIVIFQKDQIVEALSNLFGASTNATDNLGNMVGNLTII